jgi:hypothetical protein
MKVRTILDEIRPTLKHRCNIAMLDFLASFGERRKVSIRGVQYIEFFGDAGPMFLPLRRARIRSWKARCPKEMREFYGAFDGLRESKPPLNGNFVPCAEIRTVAYELWVDADTAPGISRHADCPVVFAAANGDKLIQTNEGKFAWCVVSEGRARQAAPDFPTLVKRYIDFRRIHDGHPFDSYGRG